VKAVILAGGYGTRLSEETAVRPKPMVEIGGKPILWHIMNLYTAHGITEFVICCGYKGEVIKDYFANYALRAADFTVDLDTGGVELHRRGVEPWRVTLVDTGVETMTGGRIKRIGQYVEDDTFCLTYGDGVADIDVSDLIAFHQAQGAAATLTAVQPPGRFGALVLDEQQTVVTHFHEKRKGDGESAWINGGFFVLEPKVLEYIDDDQTVWEREPLEVLAADGLLAAYRHEGFWQPMDTLRDKMVLERMWESGEAPWKLW
jgi:glucose-1-phosphate cytidylyltransferase